MDELQVGELATPQAGEQAGGHQRQVPLGGQARRGLEHRQALLLLRDRQVSREPVLLGQHEHVRGRVAGGQAFAHEIPPEGAKGVEVAVGRRHTGPPVKAQIAEVELDVLEAHVVGGFELRLLRELEEDAQVKPIPGDRVRRPHPHELKPPQEERHHVGKRSGTGDRERGRRDDGELRPAAHFVTSTEYQFGALLPDCSRAMTRWPIRLSDSPTQ
jgi:hypothetical protein